MKALAASHPNNKLLDGRGLPGSHDIPVMYESLTKLRGINEDNSPVSVDLPIYDKSQYEGRGERSTKVQTVTKPIHLVLFEGWMVGYYPIEDSQIEELYSKTATNDAFFKRHNLEHLLEVNHLLSTYAEKIWVLIDAFLILKPLDIKYTFEWRRQVG